VDSQRGHERSLADLEWPEVCQGIARYTLSDLGRARALDLGPTEDQEQAELRLSVLAEAMKLQKEGTPIPVGFVVDVFPTVESLRRSGVGSAEELAAIAQLLRVAGALDRYGENHDESCPLLGRVLAVSSELGPLTRQLDEAIDEGGVVRDEASPGLKEARRELRSLRAQVQKRVEELIGRYREALQDGYYAEREGRYVLPVRADAPFRVEGIVLGTSSSGSTLYVEPKELGQLGNKLRLAEVQVEREIALVLARLSEALGPHADEINWAQDVCVRADLLGACVQFSAQVKANVVPFGDPGSLCLKEARHPLLCLSGIEVVANDLRVTPDHGLVLSGPNAGGKTVALKTLGLLALMQATGLPVPAHPESRIGFFGEVLSDIGDDQSLSMSLSSFSGHVKRVRQILDDAGHGTLVLFDELMGGTDPDEGAVLAISMVDELVHAGAAVCVTTHYEPLKRHAGQVAHLENAAVGFDFEKMDPTFLVEMGRPGASSAIIVAERHGLPSSVTERALALLPDVIAQKREESLKLEEQAVTIQRERDELREARLEQDTLNRRLQAEIERTKEARRREITREGDALRAEIGDARALVRKLRGQLKTAEPNRLRELSSDLDKASKVVALGGPVERTLRAGRQDEGKSLSPANIHLGQKVRIKGFSSPGVVVELPRKGQIRVLIGVMKMSVSVNDLQVAGAGEKPGSLPGKSAKLSRKTHSIRRQGVLEEGSLSRTPPVRSDDVVLDLRGKRVEDSLLNLDQFIDELLRRQEIGGFVLHGHGTGAMKEAVRQHLRGHACVAESRPAERDEGGDAFTLFWVGM